MRKAIALIAFLILMTTAVIPANAFPQPADPIYVTDAVGILSAAQVDKINQAAAALEDKTGAQIAVAVIDYYEGSDIAEYAYDLYNYWGIGSSLDQGALILLATEDREIYISVGDGLSQYLSDSRAGRILDDAFIPYAQRDDFAGGLVETYFAVEAALDAMPKASLSAAGLSRPKDHIADNAGVLSGDALPNLREKLRQCYAALGVNIVVATIPSLNGESIEILANDLFNAWEVGGDYDRGMLLLIAPADGGVRIEVSDDMLATFPDSKTGAILNEAFLPYAQQSMLMAAEKTADALIADSLAAFPPVPAEGYAPPQETGADYEPLIFLILVVIVIVLIAVSMGRRRRVPPPPHYHYGTGPHHTVHHRYRHRPPHVIILPSRMHGHTRHAPPPPGGSPHAGPHRSGFGTGGGAARPSRSQQQSPSRPSRPQPPSGRSGGGFSSGGGASRSFKGGGGGRPSGGGGGRSFGGGRSSGGGSGRKF